MLTKAKSVIIGYFRNWKRTFPLTLGVLLILFALLQLVPTDQTNPPVTQALVLNPEAQKLADGACMDCHSNETEWPWYADFAPGSILAANHVNEGRDYLNLSEWDKVEDPTELLEDIEHVINEGEMPTFDYMLLHPKARLSDSEKETLIAGFRAAILNAPSESTPLETEGDAEDNDGGLIGG